MKKIIAFISLLLCVLFCLKTDIFSQGYIKSLFGRRPIVSLPRVLLMVSPMHSDRCWQWHLNEFLKDKFMSKAFYGAVIIAVLFYTAGTVPCDFTEFLSDES
jgi:hypothetical protein